MKVDTRGGERQGGGQCPTIIMITRECTEQKLYGSCLADPQSMETPLY